VCDLEPVEASNRLSRLLDAVAHRLVDA
jgi:hypothetical protein